MISSTNKSYVIGLILFVIGLIWCCKESAHTNKANNQVKIVGAMKDAMRNGELFPKIELDTIKNRDGLYGIGPVSFMRGELLILDGTQYSSHIDINDSLVVEEKSNLSAPFFVYANATKWDTITIPETIKNIKSIEVFLKNKYQDTVPFVFKLQGKITSATIHVQNLPLGTEVRSPKDAHKGQRIFDIKDENVEVLGFYSEKHQGVFTHHDAYTHMHLITKDAKYMGHLDKITTNGMRLLLPKQ